MSSTLVIPQHVAAKLAARAETCGNCRWRHKPPPPNNDTECRAHPPHASLNMVPVAQGPLARPSPMQGMQLQAFALFPLIRDDQWCGEWEAKPESLS